MRKAESPFLADWFVILVRWLVLLGAAVRLVDGTSTGLGLAIIFGLGAFINLVASILAILNRRLAGHRAFFMLADAAVCFLLFVCSGGVDGRLWWIGLQPIFTASVYYEWQGSVPLALLMTVAQSVFGYWNDGRFLIGQRAQILIVLNLLAGIMFGLMAVSLMNLLRSWYLAGLQKRREMDFCIQERERNRCIAIYRMTEDLNAATHLQTALETTLELCWSVLGGDSGPAREMVAAVLLFDKEGLLEIQAARHFPPADQRILFPAKDGILEKVVRTTKPVITNALKDDPELQRLVALYSCNSALVLPLGRDQEIYGVLLLAHPQKELFRPGNIDILENVSRQAAIAVRNVIFRENVTAEKERSIEVQEDARKKLAQNLHDGPVQAVSAIAMRISIIRKFLQVNPETVPQELEKLEELARQTSQDMRHMLFTLRPLILESQGIEVALNTMAEKMWDRFEQRVVVECEPKTADGLKPEKQAVVFSLAEEAVNNSCKFARASEIRIKLQKMPPDGSFILLQVIDNGVGFDVDETMKAYEGRGSLGMMSMQERVDMIDGLLKYDSAPGKGTCVQVVIPTTDEAKARLKRLNPLTGK